MNSSHSDEQMDVAATYYNAIDDKVLHLVHIVFLLAVIVCYEEKPKHSILSGEYQKKCNI